MSSGFKLAKFVRRAMLGGVLVTVVTVSPAIAHDYYVDGKNGRKTNLGTSAAPFLYFWQGVQAAEPGDTIHLVPSMTYSGLTISKSGSSSRPITISGDATNYTEVTGGGTAFGVWVNGNYLMVENLNVSAPGKWAGIYVPANHHHVTINNNIVHGSGGGGIGTFSDDYITITNNTVYGNSNYTANGVHTSGISTLENLDIDSSTGLKMRIVGNVVFNNTNLPTCPSSGCTSSTQDSDGNGIIDDNSRRTYIDHVAYHGQTYIANNVIFGNGGRGIHTYLSDHVVMVDNTLFFNNQDPYEGNYRPGEIEANASSDIRVYNNILYSDGLEGGYSGVHTGTHVAFSVQHCLGGTGTIYAENNLAYNKGNNSIIEYYNGSNTTPVVIQSNKWADPKLVHASLNASLANFQPTLLSPALKLGMLTRSDSVDILGVRRLAPATVGAYENGIDLP